MGNCIRGRRRAKVMKLDGETFKLKIPVQVADVLKDYPEHVLMDSDAVRHMGVRAKPLEPEENLKPKRLYFLVQLPKLPDPIRPARVRSGVIKLSAKERLESLMLSRRSMSDVSIVKANPSIVPSALEGGGDSVGPVRVRVRLPKAQVVKLIEESKDADEAAERIIELCVAYKGKGVEGNNMTQFEPSRREES
ncbi:uncharacterized protein At1g66480-like [Tasmannia lanceolata]|uniref:uncharacterized protein At1g66480-like n=1 Tax=Tasmannia lanceolata TaxID=3420 RepID=UPI0040649E94